MDRAHTRGGTRENDGLETGLRAATAARIVSCSALQLTEACAVLAAECGNECLRARCPVAGDEAVRTSCARSKCCKFRRLKLAFANADGSNVRLEACRAAKEGLAKRAGRGAQLTATAPPSPIPACATRTKDFSVRIGHTKRANHADASTGPTTSTVPAPAVKISIVLPVPFCFVSKIKSWEIGRSIAARRLS